MKDVSNTITKRLQRLDGHFSLDWQSDFKTLLLFLKSNSKTHQIVKGIQEDKVGDHALLIDNFEHLLEDSRLYLQQVTREIKLFTYPQIKQDIEELRSVKIPKEKLTDPFFKLESFYSEYYRRWMGLIRRIVGSGKEYEIF